MSTAGRTISIKPSRSEHARIIAYIFANHTGAPVEFFGDYWNLTDAQENALFGTFNKLEELNVGDFSWHVLPTTHKAKLIKSLFTEIYKECSAN